MTWSEGTAYILYALPKSAASYHAGTSVKSCDVLVRCSGLWKSSKFKFSRELFHDMPAKEKNPADKQETNNFILQSSKTFKQQSLLKLVDIHEDGIVQSYNLIQNLLLGMAFPTLQRQFEDIETRNKSNQT
ncbi:uncharacterized protein LOC111367460 [Olea europaea var. sylvestris]|uniref:uncharacterized protein LOC111367460 n=1 Tax=Olea europaea var. sylvestris TaxID=158386 RepID=UPI000C1D88B3|nr:uncharacterized protein LOC111367460 [Olea europaea var. sylvestris]XP_022844113.1 uncharacterized protein LOC111367460 [Olea europaea var. sylvestris]XP_022844114.1 uncharacterized protein LOC111367460 [Olea europaea var. sylvestris]XP_022844115.1 uncharacterized protein LOC111367460 [Olea europaea var. sylvestris]XP_022844116.1 uncharacterized protein LOC111367460 [Olea europaea var. sylvestris]